MVLPWAELRGRRRMEAKRQILVVEARVVTEHESRHCPEKASHLVELFAGGVELYAETGVDVFIEVFEQDAPSRFNAGLNAGVQFLPEAIKGPSISCGVRHC